MGRFLLIVSWEHSVSSSGCVPEKPDRAEPEPIEASIGADNSGLGSAAVHRRTRAALLLSEAGRPPQIGPYRTFPAAAAPAAAAAGGPELSPALTAPVSAVPALFATV